MFIRKPLKIEKNKKLEIDNQTLLGIPYYIILALLIILPMLLIIFYAFVDYKQGLYMKFTFKFFTSFFNNNNFIRVLLRSIYYSVMTTLVCLILGYPIAYSINKLNKKAQSIIFLLITAPMWINMLLRLNGLKTILGDNSILVKIIQIFGFKGTTLLGTSFSIVLGMVYVFLPFMVIPIYTTLSKLDYIYIESSYDLGANKKQTFLKVILPLSLPGILSGITMVLLPSATTLVVQKILGEGKSDFILIGNLIEEKFVKAGNMNSFNEGAAMSLIIATIIMLMIYFTKKLDRFNENEQD